MAHFMTSAHSTVARIILACRPTVASWAAAFAVSLAESEGSGKIAVALAAPTVGVRRAGEACSWAHRSREQHHRAAHRWPHPQSDRLRVNSR